MRRDDIKSMAKTLGPRGFALALADLLEGRDQAGTQVPKIRAEDLSLRVLWEALVGPVEETLAFAMRASGRLSVIEMQEAVDSTAFTSATSVLIASKVVEGYDQPNMIGDELVTILPSKLKQERVVGFTSLEGPQEVAEGMPYNESSFAEKYVTTDTAKKGRILAITEEAIFFDQTGQIMVRAARLGEQTRLEREEVILAGVLDIGTATANGYKSVYRPSGTAETLYSAGNNNYLATATPLVDWTDIDEALQYHADNVRDDRAASGERRPIMFFPRDLLVARKLAGTAARILTATEQRSGDITTGTGSQVISGNPIRNIAPGLRALSSPMIDYLAGLTGSNYDDSDDWLIGDFKRQFMWQEIWPLQVLRARQDDDAAFRRDVVVQHKVRYYGGIFASEERFVLKINAV